MDRGRFVWNNEGAAISPVFEDDLLAFPLALDLESEVFVATEMHDVEVPGVGGNQGKQTEYPRVIFHRYHFFSFFIQGGSSCFSLRTSRLAYLPF